MDVDKPTIRTEFSNEKSPFQPLLSERDIMIPMSDGTRLAADIYRPAENGRPVESKFPAVLQRTPYNKRSEKFVAQAEYFVRHGYVAVLQDCRGRYRSEGVFNKYMDEPQDGFDTVEWVSSLPYCNRKVGMWGLSYGAHVQACAAKMNPPHLCTVILNMGGTSNGWDHSVRNNGAFALKQIAWAFRQVAEETPDPVIRDMLKVEKAADWFQALPLKKGLNPFSIVPNFEAYVFEMMTHANYDDYWKKMGVNWVEYYNQTADIPMIHISGWYDAYCESAIQNYLALSRAKKSPIRLLIGPWLHGESDQTSAGDAEFGPEAAIRNFFDAWHLRWFDHFLKGEDQGLDDESPVKLFVMGTGDGRRDENGRLLHGGYWRDEADWPLPATRFTNYHFHCDGSLSVDLPAANDPPTTYTYDPRHPVPTIGGPLAAFDPLCAGGAYDQREREYKGDARKGFFGSRAPYLPLRARPDIVVFQTDPLSEPLEIIGPIVVKLYASSTATDTDFTVKLIDVYPPSKDFPSGFDLNLTDGILRARYRNSPERQELMKPGEIYEFIIKPFGTANLFKKGHRIRVDISSSNFPRFDVNPNTGEPLGMNRRAIPADNTIYHDLIYPSHVILPVIPKGSNP